MYGPVAVAKSQPKSTSLLDLPDDLVARVVGAADQCGAVGCMLTCKQLYAAVRNPAIWTTVELGVLDASTIEFMTFASECHTLKIETSSLDEVVWFLLCCHLKSVAALATVQTLEITITERCNRMTSALFDAIAHFTALRNLAVTLSGVDNSDDISVDMRMPELESFSFEEHADVIEDLHYFDESSVVLNLQFAARCHFPALKKLRIATMSANVFQVLPGAPHLCSLAYVCAQWEEDVIGHLDGLEGRYMEDMTLCLHRGSGAVYRVLERAFDERLQLICFHDATIGRPLVNVGHIELVLSDMVTLYVDFVSLSEDSDFESLHVTCPLHFQNADVHVHGVPAMDHWVRYWQRKRMTTSFVTVSLDHRQF